LRRSAKALKSAISPYFSHSRMEHSESRKGRLKLAQDEILGGVRQTRAVPEGRLKWEGRSPVYPQPFFTAILPGFHPGESSAVPVRQAQGRLCGTEILRVTLPSTDVLGYFQPSLRDSGRVPAEHRRWSLRNVDQRNLGKPGLLAEKACSSSAEGSHSPIAG
jgi:hypothetical protein